MSCRRPRRVRRRSARIEPSSVAAWCGRCRVEDRSAGSVGGGGTSAPNRRRSPSVRGRPDRAGARHRSDHDVGEQRRSRRPAEPSLHGVRARKTVDGERPVQRGSGRTSARVGSARRQAPTLVAVVCRCRGRAINGMSTTSIPVLASARNPSYDRRGTIGDLRASPAERSRNPPLTVCPPGGADLPRGRVRSRLRHPRNAPGHARARSRAEHRGRSTTSAGATRASNGPRRALGRRQATGLEPIHEAPTRCGDRRRATRQRHSTVDGRIAAAACVTTMDVAGRVVPPADADRCGPGVTAPATGVCQHALRTVTC